MIGQLETGCIGTGCGTRTRDVVSVIKSDVQSPLCQASLEIVPPTCAAQV